MIYDIKAYLRGIKDAYREEAQGGLDFWAEKGDNQKGPYHLYRSFYAMHNVIAAYLNNNS